MLNHFEQTLNLRPTQAAKLLGLDYRRYNEFKNGSRDLKPYHIASIEAHLALPKRELNKRLTNSEAG